MSTKWWVLVNRGGVGKDFEILNGGVKMNGGSEFEKRLTIIIKRQKHVIIKQKTKIHAEARYTFYS